MRKKILFLKDIMSIKDTAFAHRKYVKDILSVKDITFVRDIMSAIDIKTSRTHARTHACYKCFEVFFLNYIISFIYNMCVIVKHPNLSLFRFTIYYVCACMYSSTEFYAIHCDRTREHGQPSLHVPGLFPRFLNR